MLALHPHYIDDFGVLRQAMTEARAKAGQPSLAELQEQAGRTADGQRNRLPSSSLSAVLRGTAVPQRDHVTAFAQALGFNRRAVGDWEQAWDRAAQRTAGRSAPLQHTTSPRPRRSQPRPAGGGPAPGTAAPPARRPEPRDDVFRFLTAPPSTLDLRTGFEVVGVRQEDLDFVRSHVIAPSNLEFLEGWLGPEAAHPPAGRTDSGLPIRVPKRYHRTGSPSPFLQVGRAGVDLWFTTAVSRARSIVGLPPAPSTVLGFLRDLS